MKRFLVPGLLPACVLAAFVFSCFSCAAGFSGKAGEAGEANKGDSESAATRQPLKAESVKVAALYNLTGGMSSIDAPGLNGVKLAASLINFRGGVRLRGKNSVKVEIIAYDTKSDMLNANKIASEAVSLQPVAGVGFGDTTFVIIAAPAFQMAGIPFVTSGATLTALPRIVGNRIFMAAYGDDSQAKAMAAFAVKTFKPTDGAANVAILADTTMAFTRELSEYFKSFFTSMGGKIVLEDQFVSGDTDFSSQVSKLKAKSPAPDAIFVSSAPEDAPLLVKQIRAAGVGIPILSGDGFDCNIAEAIKDDKIATNIYFTTHDYMGDNRPEVLDFIVAYEKEYGRKPENAFAALGFDAMNMIADAI
ncbi:MAG: ABC transporter substrate-binding protein, partial [Nitrospirae bacterium]|nr:ABC transporter substrate-binding protein [Nitrospirota bacterium]